MKTERRGKKEEGTKKKTCRPFHGALMCHLTEIPPMRRIDLQSDAPRQRVGAKGGLEGVARIHEEGGPVGADPRNSWSESSCFDEELWASRDEIYLLLDQATRVALPGNKGRDKYGTGSWRDH